MKAIRGFALGALLLIANASGVLAQDIIGFDSVTPGINVPPATDPNGTFAAENDPFRTVTITAGPSFSFAFNGNGPFTAANPPVFGASLEGNVLAHLQDSAPDIMTLLFNSPVHSVSIDFALIEQGTLELSAPTLSLVDTESGTLMSLSNSYEGTLSLTSATLFSSVQIRSATSIADYGIDNIRVTPQAVPEPPAMAFGACALLTALICHRRGSKLRNR